MTAGMGAVVDVITHIVLDLRERVVAAVSSCVPGRKVAERFGVSPASTVRWCALAD